MKDTDSVTALVNGFLPVGVTASTSKEAERMCYTGMVSTMNTHPLTQTFL